jgi:hypothetical protein
MAIYPAKVIRPVVGGPYEAIDGSLYAYSGEINFDVTASASYQMMKFSLTEEARFKVNFGALYKVLQSTNSGYGYNIVIDGISVWNFSSDTSGGRNGDPNTSDIKIYIPANATTEILLLNPDASAGLLKATCVLNGKYLDKAKGKGSAGVQIGDDALPPMIAQRERMVGWNKELF